MTVISFKKFNKKKIIVATPALTYGGIHVVNFTHGLLRAILNIL